MFSVWLNKSTLFFWPTMLKRARNVVACFTHRLLFYTFRNSISITWYHELPTKKKQCGSQCYGTRAAPLVPLKVKNSTIWSKYIFPQKTNMYLNLTNVVMFRGLPGLCEDLLSVSRLWYHLSHLCRQQKSGMSKSRNFSQLGASVVDPKTLNLDPDPQFWSISGC